MSDEASNIVINLRPIDQMRLDQLRERTETALTSDNVWYIHTVLAQCFLLYRTHRRERAISGNKVVDARSAPSS